MQTVCADDEVEPARPRALEADLNAIGELLDGAIAMVFQVVAAALPGSIDMARVYVASQRRS